MQLTLEDKKSTFFHGVLTGFDFYLVIISEPDIQII